MPIGEGHQVEFARAVKAGSELPVMAVGMIFRPQHAEEIVANGDADLVGLARGMLQDPHWPWRAAAALGTLNTRRNTSGATDRDVENSKDRHNLVSYRRLLSLSLPGKRLHFNAFLKLL